MIGTTMAQTNYSYDAADNVVKIVDPTGGTTTMLHDFAGHRVLITRAGATWKFGYDKNGNLNSETFPGSTTATIQNYINTTTYDNLDRPSGKTIGQRGLNAADIATFGAGYEWMLWDIGANASGRLGILYSYTPTGTQPVTTSQYVYDLAGHEQYISESCAELPGKTPTYLRHHTLLGNVQDTYYYDYPAQDRASFSKVHYDARGLPIFIELSLSTSTATLNIAQQTRNVSGLVTKRHTDVTGSPMTFTESNWTYDKLGRVASQVVQDGPGPVQVARQDLAYFGNDDPKTLDQWLGSTNHKHFTYGYDLQHEVTSVGETLLPNAFTAAYAFNNAGRFTSAIETVAALPNSDVATRNVTYNYSATDPEQVTALVNTNSTIAWAYAYDASGNQTMRCAGQIISGSCTGANETDYRYDGNDRLRRVTQKSSGAVQGSEEYWYDGHGNRNVIVKKDSAGNKTETIWFIVDTEAHYDGAGNWVHSYANVSIGTPVARVDTGLSFIGKLEYQFHGLANNTLAAVDSSTGTVNARFSYAPFGEVIEATNAGTSAGLAAHRRRQNDKYFDEASNLTYYGARFYDKTSMSWTQEDPLYRRIPDAAKMATPRRASLYLFSMNNPMRYMDPDGQDPQDWGAGQFFNHGSSDSVAAAGDASAGGGFGRTPGPGETFSTGQRQYFQRWAQADFASFLAAATAADRHTHGYRISEYYQVFSGGVEGRVFGQQWTALLRNDPDRAEAILAVVAVVYGSVFIGALAGAGAAVAVAGGSISTATAVGEGELYIGIASQETGTLVAVANRASSLTHEFLASRLGVYLGPRTLAAGYAAVTFGKDGGQMMVLGSINFTTFAPSWAIDIVMKNYK